MGKNFYFGMSIILAINLFIVLICIWIVSHSFRKFDFSETKDYRKKIKIAFANGFFASSIFSIVFACLIYGFLENILEAFGTSTRSYQLLFICFQNLVYLFPIYWARNCSIPIFLDNRMQKKDRFYFVF
ncbi:MAG: hypothetical protein IJ867_03125 [Clostridia bacterium]|nr:hypothetical protein [Clostridia bacterium]